MSTTRRLLSGRYELRDVIGHGGMSTVYRAHDRVLGRDVAIKLLSPALAEGAPANVARFEREARAAAALNQASVVAVYDTGEEDGARYIVMELIEGRTLAEVLREQAPLAPARAARIGAGIAEALVAAHAAGIVHRDIKPSNVMLTGAGEEQVKVLDFGIARALEGTAITAGTAVLGTAAYMAPEQALGEPVDERSDLYSLGCLLYALLAGHPPFQGEGHAAVMHQHVSATPRRLRRLDPRVPPALDALVAQLLAKSPADRPADAAGVRERLLTVADTLDAKADTAATVPLARASAAGASLTRAQSAASWDRTRRIVGLAGLPAAVAVVLIVVLASSGGSQPAKHHAAAVKAAQAGHSGPARTAARTTLPSTPAQTLEAALAGASAQLARDVREGTVDPAAAAMIEPALAAVRAGETEAAQRRLSALVLALPALVRAGHIKPSAVPPLQGSLGALAAALAALPRPSGEGPSGGGEAGPPADHGHGHGNGHGHGDGGGGEGGGD